MRRTSLAALLTILLVGLPAAASADEPFQLPEISVVEIDQPRGVVVLFDESTGRHARLALGSYYDQNLRLVRVHHDRIVLRRTGTHVYYVFPVGGDGRVREREPRRQQARATSALLPHDPYGAHAERQTYREASEEPARINGGVIDPFAYTPRRHADPGANGRDQRPISAYDDRDSQPAYHRRDDLDLRPINPYDEGSRQTPPRHHREPIETRPVNPYDDRDFRRDHGRHDERARPAYDRGQSEASHHERRPVNPYGDREPEPAARHHLPAHAASAEPARAPSATEQPRNEARAISRARLDATLSDFRALERQIRIRSEGTAVRVTYLAGDSLMYEMGLRQGDLIQRVAGRQLDTVEAAAALYAHLARTDRFDLELVRQGQPLVLRYRLIP